MTTFITAPNPLLKEKSKAVVVDKQTLELVARMKHVLTKTEGIKGVGLAAVQIGVPKKVFLAYSEKSKELLTFINAEIIWYSKVFARSNFYEGCFCVPNVWAMVHRAKTIKIRYQTETGKQLVKKYDGKTAAYIQHEYDHTQGVLFTERALQQGNKLYALKADDEGQSYFEEIKL